MGESRSTPSRLVAIVATAIAGLVVTGGLAYAAIPSDGVITACYIKSGGALRVIDASVAKCKSGETRLDWNVSGVPGEDGSDGADGVSGYELVKVDRIFPPGTTASFGGLVAECPAGKKALGGGGVFIEENLTPIASSQNTIIASYPQEDPSGWVIDYFANRVEPDGVTGVRVFATCASVN